MDAHMPKITNRSAGIAKLVKRGMEEGRWNQFAKRLRKHKDITMAAMRSMAAKTK